MNVELLLKVKEKILAEPRQFRMDYFYSQNNLGIEIPNCGTAACIGGWARAVAKQLNPKQASENNIFENNLYPGQEELGLTDVEATRLMFDNRWPRKFHEAFHDAYDNFDKRAKVAADRINHFIATNGKE